jgi:hypothetical protein
VIVQTKANRLGMYLLGQAFFSAQLMRRFHPRSVESVALVLLTSYEGRDLDCSDCSWASSPRVLDRQDMNGEPGRCTERGRAMLYAILTQPPARVGELFRCGSERARTTRQTSNTYAIQSHHH